MEETTAATDERDRLLIRRYLEGQGDAAQGLVERYHQRLFNVALRMLNNVQDAEDVTQTAFCNAFLKLRSYNPKYRFFSWIYRITVNEALNTLKRRQQTGAVTLEDILAAPAPEAERAAEDEDLVGRALMLLKPDDRAAVVLKHFLSFSYEEIAEVLEIPVQTVKSRLFEARERLRTTMRQQEH